MVLSFSFKEVMKVGDLVKIDMHGDELCLVTEIKRSPKWKDEQVTLYFPTGLQRCWTVSIKYVELVCAAG